MYGFSVSVWFQCHVWFQMQTCDVRCTEAARNPEENTRAATSEGVLQLGGTESAQTRPVARIVIVRARANTCIHTLAFHNVPYMGGTQWQAY